MNKQELIDAIAKESKLTRVDSKKALDAIIKAITKALKKGDKVVLVGFGSFSVTKRSSRTGRNPQTGQAIKIPTKNVVRFKSGSVLLPSVDEGPGYGSKYKDEIRFRIGGGTDDDGGGKAPGTDDSGKEEKPKSK